MSRELWEIVRADELKIGDVVFCEYHGTGITLERHEDGDPPWLWEANGGESWGFENEPIFRRVPDTDDPRVLRRALRLAIFALYDEKLYVPTAADPKNYLDQARRELKSEGSDDQA